MSVLGPGDEVPHEAEALTLAASLFPDQGRENRFFVEAPSKIFAHLLNLKPTPQELTYWMSNADEIDKRVAGTELAAMIDKGAADDTDWGQTKSYLSETVLELLGP